MKSHFLFALLPVALGCSEIIDYPDDPELVGEKLTPWSCVGKVKEPPPATQGVATVSFYACNFIKDCQEPVTGLTGTLCALKDSTCASPLKNGHQGQQRCPVFRGPNQPNRISGVSEDRFQASHVFRRKDFRPRRGNPTVPPQTELRSQKAQPRPVFSRLSRHPFKFSTHPFVRTSKSPNPSRCCPAHNCQLS